MFVRGTENRALIGEGMDLRQKLHKMNLCGRIKWNEKSIKYWRRTEKK